MAAGQFTAALVTTPTLTVDQFFATPPVTPGNVGICLSGGGSRALTAGMGQLQALSYLTANGAPLLAQVKAISTVSGGSWLGVPFSYLRASGPADAAFLGTFTPDQSMFTKTQLAQLPAGNACVPITSDLFMPELLAVEAYLLYEFLDVPPYMLWQTVIALNLLSPCGLFSPDTSFAPTDLFSYDQQVLQSAVTGPNPALAAETADLAADTTTTGRIRRPYLICNMGMFLKRPNTAMEMLAPVQATPFFTGVVGGPSGTDYNGNPVGGGGVTSFAFDSFYVSSSGQSAEVNQQRQWALADIAGTSSAFYAEKLTNLLAEWQANPAELARIMLQDADEILRWIDSHFDPATKPAAKAFVRQPVAAAATPSAAGSVSRLSFSVADLQAIDPAYYAWSPASPVVVPQPLRTAFADGGSLENTGIGGMLAYEDIDALIAFVNSMQPLVLGQYGIAGGNGLPIPGTTVIVDDAIPPLFGYQPYQSGQPAPQDNGYVLYAGATSPTNPTFANNQVFPLAAFQDFLQNIWQASGAGTNASPATYAQTLAVQPNAWFGIKGNRTVTVVWCHLNPVTAWQQQFVNNADVAQLVAEAVTSMNFPNYDTFNTQLTATDVNLLAALTSWCIATADAQNKVFSGLFVDAAAGRAAARAVAAT